MNLESRLAVMARSSVNSINCLQIKTCTGTRQVTSVPKCPPLLDSKLKRDLNFSSKSVENGTKGK
jgi:hypothetical protein